MSEILKYTSVWIMKQHNRLIVVLRKKTDFSLTPSGERMKKAYFSCFEATEIQ